jgi:RNA polymerase sigma-70 factor (ECF subfamily)
VTTRPGSTGTEAAAVLAAVRGGDAAAFTALAERYRRQLHVHCYRMLGSFEDAEDLVPATDPATLAPGAEPVWAPEVPWLQPYPDHLLEPAAPSDAEPDAVVVSRETIELTYLTAIQHLPARCSGGTWTPTSAATRPRWSPCCARTPARRCRRRRCGSTAATGWPP